MRFGRNFHREKIFQHIVGFIGQTQDILRNSEIFIKTKITYIYSRQCL